MTKKFLSVLLALVMVISIAPVSVFAEDNILDYLTYEINDGEVTITDCDTSISGEVFIPDTIEEYPVTAIGYSAFTGCDKFNSITIPDSVTTIDGLAFWNCYRLTNITIPNSVTSIGGGAFEGCTSLTSITIPESVTTIIGNSVFGGCDSLTCITVAEENENYSNDEYGALFNKDKTELLEYPVGNSRTEYAIPDGVTTIGVSAFSGCTSLTEITIPDSVASIGYAAFYGCTSLTSFEISDSVTTIDGRSFCNCTSLTSIEIPDSVTSIGFHAFYNCFSLTSITIPNSVTSIGQDAIGYNYGEVIDGFIIYGVPGSVAETYAIENGITFIDINLKDDNSLENAHSYEAVITAPTCTEQGYTTYTCSICGDNYIDNYVDASDAYHTYESVVTPAELEVEGYTTYTCTVCGDSFAGDYTPALHSYPEGSLNCDICGKYAFKYEINNGEVTITDCDESISGDIAIPDTIEGYPVTTISGYALNWCKNLTGITIPDSVTSVEVGAFYFCTKLANVAIGAGLTSICDEMFYGCSSLQSITIPDNVTEIGGGAFFTSGIEVIKIPSSVTTIGPEAFAHCPRLVSVELLDGVTTIENGAFFGCENLESIIIPASVTTFSFETFDHCEKVKIYGYAGSVAETYANENGITFVAITSEDDVVVPDKPVQDTSTALKPNTENITVTDTVAASAPEMSVDAIKNSVENENVQILDKDGKELTKDAIVGTGSKINILDKDGNILSTYEVMVKADVDGNGKITTADARLTLRASVGLDTIVGVYATAANYDGKDNVSTADARMILRKAVGLE